MHAWRRKEEGVERGSAYVAVCLFVWAPCVWELLLVCFCLCSSRVDISFVPSSLCCYSVNPLEAEALLQPRHLQTGSEERRHHAEGGANHSGALGKTAPHACTHPSEHTLFFSLSLKKKKSPCCETNRLLMLLNTGVLGQPAYSMS